MRIFSSLPNISQVKIALRRGGRLGVRFWHSLILRIAMMIAKNLLSYGIKRKKRTKVFFATSVKVCKAPYG